MMLDVINTLLLALLIIKCGVRTECPPPINTCERGKISFYLYKELLQPYEELILGDNNSIRNITFIPKGDIKLLVHGYTGSKDRPPAMVTTRNEYLKLKKFNVLVVDWGPLAIDGCYHDTAFKCVEIVGKCCAQMVNSILENKPEIKEDNIHVVSWSMGAQVSARFANAFRPRVVRRISGMDPAFPLFTPGITKPHNILNRNHAKFVDVMHCNMGTFGVYFSNAHYDIYVNTGTFQPGCDLTDVSCHHRRATEMFAESINSPVKFIARKCDHNWVFVTFRKCDGHSDKRIEIGEYCKPPADEKDTGTYHIRTHDHPPYAIPPDKN